MNLETKIVCCKSYESAKQYLQIWLFFKFRTRFVTLNKSHEHLMPFIQYVKIIHIDEFCFIFIINHSTYFYICFLF